MNSAVWILAVLLDVGEVGQVIGYIFDDEDKCFAIADFIEQNIKNPIMCSFQASGATQWVTCNKVVSMSVREANPNDPKEQKPVTPNIAITSERAAIIN